MLSTISEEERLWQSKTGLTYRRNTLVTLAVKGDVFLFLFGMREDQKSKEFMPRARTETFSPS